MIDLLLGRKIEPPSFRSTDGQTVLLRLDACIAQKHHYENELSEYPVEDGFDATDHIKQKPDMITIEGVVSNSPVAGIFLNSVSNAQPVSDYNTIVGDGKDRVVTAYEMLVLISGRRLIKVPDLSGDIVRQTIPSKPIMFDLSTKLRVFTDMVIKKLDFDFDKMTGDSLPFKATCRHIQKVSTKESTINYANGNITGAGGIEDQTTIDDKGQQQTTEPTEEKMSSLKAFATKEGSMGERISAGVKHLFDF